MLPADMTVILNQLNNLPTEHGFPANARPFIFQEVIDLGNEPITSAEYVGNGRVTEFKYGRDLGVVVRKQEDQKLSYLKNFGEGWGMMNDSNALVFVDNHDNQRGHGAGGASILTFRDARMYKTGVAFMLAWPYGVSRVMSSYFWEQDWQGGVDQNDWIGPPHDDNMNTLPVEILPDMSCGNGWICEHRWRQIYNMVAFRNVVAGTEVTQWWDNAGNQISFCRGNKGFVAINNEIYNMVETLQTCLPLGIYCDVISGNVVDGKCTGQSISVGNDGRAFISIESVSQDPIIAIHIGSKVA
jgi:alpha-amylase